MVDLTRDNAGNNEVELMFDKENYSLPHILSVFCRNTENDEDPTEDGFVAVFMMDKENGSNENDFHPGQYWVDEFGDGEILFKNKDNEDGLPPEYSSARVVYIKKQKHETMQDIFLVTVVIEPFDKEFDM